MKLFYCAAVLVLPLPAFATSVPIAPPPTGTVLGSLSAPFDVSGTTAVGSIPFAFSGTFNQDALLQPNGTITFAYHFTITSHIPPETGIDAGTVQIIDLIGFDPATFPVIQASPGPGNLYPLNASFDVPANPLISRFHTGGIDFQQIPANSTDTSSRVFFITTDATNFDPNGVLTLVITAGDQQFAKQFSSFEPLAAAVPEPLSLALIPLALAALRLRNRRI